MSNITQITLASGIPSGPSGTVSTLDALMADGGQATLGSQGDTTWSGTGSGTLIAIQKYLSVKLEAIRALLAGTLTVAGAVTATTVDQYATHKEVGAGATATVLGTTGATGDYLSHVVVFPGASNCGVVTVLDGAGTVGTFAGGGTTALPALAPIMIPIGAFSSSGAWKITTGANVTVTAVGKFT